MKKYIIIILTIFVIIIAIYAMTMLNIQTEQKQTEQFNKSYVQYQDKIILGSDIATVINKAIDNNEKYQIPKNEKNNYINDGNNSIQIFIQLETDGVYYEMERINSLKITEFVKNFSLQDFKCSKILYHESTKRVSQIYFDIVED